MSDIRIIGKRGSRSRITITKATGIRRYTNKSRNVSAIVNYGLAGGRLQTFLRKHPSASKLPIMNRNTARSKYDVVLDAERENILVPESKLTLPKSSKLTEWIEKRHHSIGGIGITRTRRRHRLDGKYYQKFISNRRYELRVHAFSWTDDWHIQKRVGDPKEVAWNYKNGGKFITVHNTSYNIFQEAIEVSKKILEMRKMAFGAVDFIIADDGKLYFIEINSAPGFTEFSEHIYVDAFNKLQRLTNNKIIGMCT